MKTGLKWFGIGVGAASAVVLITVGANIWINASDGDSAVQSASTTYPVVTVHPVATTTAEAATPDEKMDRFLNLSSIATGGQTASYHDLARRECANTDLMPRAKLEDRAVIIQYLPGTNFKDAAVAELFLKEAIRDYCPQYSNLTYN